MTIPYRLTDKGLTAMELSTLDAARLVLDLAVGPEKHEALRLAQWLACEADAHTVMQHVICAGQMIETPRGELPPRELEKALNRRLEQVDRLVGAALVLLRRFR
jgi:hypothetical protein